MGRSLRIVGIVSEDNSTYRDMLGVRNACIQAKIDVPMNVEAYFDNLEKRIAYRDLSNVDSEILEFGISDIPTGVDLIRIIMTY